MDDDNGGEDATLASSFEEGHVLVDAAEDFAEQVEDETDGAVSIEVIPGGSYGAEDEIAEQVQEGVIEMHSGGGVPYEMFASEYYFFDNPFVLEDLDHLRDIEDSEEFEPAQETLIDEGNQRHVGSFIFRGLRHFTANQAVTEPDDLDGVDLRLPELDPWVTIWEEIGASATSVALDELYSALEQGVADASEGDIAQISSHNLQEVQDYLSLTGHQVQAGGLYVNDDFFEGLDEAHQDAILEIAEEASLDASDRAEDEEDDLIAELEDDGMEVVDDVDQDAFADLAEPAVEDLFDSTWEGSWDDWQNL
ncbi:TRAP transporter substrate-binding protein [Natronolimnobius sp. AArcel1]|uniref:TRAP transporter substrate-binding protein n=1 Tax=Natronolimnobius sp. AArcel1 TaxID=1679093 RepID=UPI0013EC982A|nr:TRAP transporter substrate-binding protein [Natronolimnobius sp. AArcel1]NGM67959.1 TRAP transporter substrate-binding protein [Natronolimnobius sp. AArcel1]